MIESLAARRAAAQAEVEEQDDPMPELEWDEAQVEYVDVRDRRTGELLILRRTTCLCDELGPEERCPRHGHPR